MVEVFQPVCGNQDAIVSPQIGSHFSNISKTFWNLHFRWKICIFVALPRFDEICPLSPSVRPSLQSCRSGLLTLSTNFFPCRWPGAGWLNSILARALRCDQIYKYMLYDFGHNLLCYLSQT
jgi:hypothetical protein